MFAIGWGTRSENPTKEPPETRSLCGISKKERTLQKTYGVETSRRILANMTYAPVGMAPSRSSGNSQSPAPGPEKHPTGCYNSKIGLEGTLDPQRTNDVTTTLRDVVFWSRHDMTLSRRRTNVIFKQCHCVLSRRRTNVIFKQCHCVTSYKRCLNVTPVTMTLPKRRADVTL
ncbi:Uncharacterised protein r2_g2457 [Pycnogonum litorale]